MSRKPKLGQNFLVDPGASLAIVQALGDVSARTVLEIGPGRGAITGLLATRARRLIAVELDASLAPQLKAQYAANPNIHVLQQDILTVDFTHLDLSPGEELVVIGNLPYYITSDILLHLFDHAKVIDRAVIMMQREVADRVSAEPGNRDYGLLTATTQLYASVENLFTLPPSSFAPPPDVHSTVIRLTFAPRFEELRVNATDFISFLKVSFAQKRKTLANNLRFAGYDPGLVAAAFRQAELPPGIRAEALPLQAAARLWRALHL